MQCNFSKPKAIALIKGENNSAHISGTVKFYNKDGCVLIVVDVNGLPYNETGFYGFHIHEGNNCGGNDFSGSASHYNPTNTQHPKHSGDLPPLMLCGNTAHLSVLTNRFDVSDIIGRTVIIHNKPDDFTTQPSGNSGEKIACGLIKKI